MSSKTIHKLRSLFFTPDSWFELWVRSLYHRLARTKLLFWLRDWLARRSYKKYRQQQRAEKPPELASQTAQPIITFLVDHLKNHDNQLTATIASIQNLEIGRWQVLVVCDPSSYSDPQVSEIKSESPFQIIDLDQHDWLEAVKGEFVIFCQAGDQFFPTLLARFYHLFAQNPNADLVYYDCEIRPPDQPFPWPVFKPCKPSPALCLSYNPFSRGLFRTTSLRHHLNKNDPHEGFLLKEYALSLMLLEHKAQIAHIPSVLVSQSNLVKSDSPEVREMICEYLARSGAHAPSARETQWGTNFQWSHGDRDPSLAIIIPSKNNASLLRPLVQSIFGNNHHQALTVTIVDNNSDDAETLALYREIQKEHQVQVLPYRKPFNFSEAINLGVQATASDLILLMNDDMAPLDALWLPEMIQWTQLEDVGVVGAKLLRTNHTLQHVGIIMGLVGFAGHIYLNAPEHYRGLWGSSDWYRDLLAVTGACQMMRRKVFEQVGGYDPGFKLAFGDIDFCLRVYKQGYRNIYTPFARLYHYEGQSRGYVTPIQDTLRGYERFETFLLQDDPYFSPNLTYSRIPQCAGSRTTLEERRQQIEIRKSFYLHHH